MGDAVLDSVSIAFKLAGPWKNHVINGYKQPELKLRDLMTPSKCGQEAPPGAWGQILSTSLGAERFQNDGSGTLSLLKPFSTYLLRNAVPASWGASGI